MVQSYVRPRLPDLLPEYAEGQIGRPTQQQRDDGTWHQLHLALLMHDRSVYEYMLLIR